MDFDVALWRAWKKHQSVLPTDQLATMTYMQRMQDGVKLLRFNTALMGLTFRPERVSRKAGRRVS